MPSIHPTALAVQEALAQAASERAWQQYAGPRSESLRQAIAECTQRSHVRLCSSGTLAVELAIRSLKLPPDSEVLIAGYDFPGNFRAVEDAGHRVALMDISPSTWIPSRANIESAISDDTKAIVVSHLHSDLAPMASICEWANQHGIAIIEDACQSHGATVDGRPAGSWGDASVFSFGGSKLIASGRGGSVMTNDATLAQRMTIYCERGNDAFAMSELQCAALLPQFRHLAADHQLRSQAANQLEQGLANIDWLHLPSRVQSTLPSSIAFYKFGLLIAKHLQSTSVQHLVNKIATDDGEQSWVEEFRNRVVSALAQRGIQMGAGFRGFAQRSRKRYRRDGDLPNTQYAVQGTMVLHHQHLLDLATGESSIDRVVEAFQQVHKELTL